MYIYIHNNININQSTLLFFLPIFIPIHVQLLYTALNYLRTPKSI